MDKFRAAWMGIGTIAGAVAVAALSGSPARATAPPPEKEVIVVNTPQQPVPVVGAVTVSGSTTVTGDVNAAQAGPWNVGASQNGPWVVGINPAQNAVSLAPGKSFFFDSGFSVINDGQTLELGPFDLSGLNGVRLVVFAVNGDIRANVRVNSNGFTFPLEEFVVPGEDDGPITESVVYDYPPPSITIRLTEGGPGGSNYQVMLIGQ
jgi:hypothetical protein